MPHTVAEQIAADDFITRLRRQPTLTGPRAHEFIAPANQAIIVVGPVNLRGHLFDLPVHIEGVIFENYVDLSECRFAHALRIENGRFRQGIRLADTHVEGRMSLRGSQFTDAGRGWLDWRRLRVGGVFDLTAITSTVGIDLSNLVAGDDLRLDGLRGRSALLNKKELDEVHFPQLTEDERIYVAQEMLDKALNLEGAAIRKHVYVYTFGNRRVHLKGMLDVRAKIGGGIELSGTIVDVGKAKIAVTMDAADVGLSVYFSNQTKITGIVILRAKVGRDVKFTNTMVNAGSGSKAVLMDLARVGGSVTFKEGSIIIGQVSMLGAQVDGQVQVENVTVTTEVGKIALDMEAAIVGSSILFYAKTKIIGQLGIRAKVSGYLQFNDVLIDAGQDNVAIDASGAEIDRAVFFRDNTKIIGSLDLRAKVGGQVDFSSVTIDANKGSMAVAMDDAEVCDSIFFRSRTKISGQVNLRARVRRQVEFTDMIIDVDKGKRALTMDAAEIGGSVIFDQGTRLNGQVCLHAKIGGSVDFSNVTLDVGAANIAVDMQGADVNESVFFREKTNITGRIDLQAKVGGQVAFLNSHIDAETSNYAVTLYAANIGGLLAFGRGTKIIGQLDLRAKVGGNVVFFDVTVNGLVGSTSVDLYGAEVGGSIQFNQRSMITGQVGLQAKVGGNVSFIKTVVDAGVGNIAVNLSSANVSGSIFIRDGTTVNGLMDLRAKVRGQVDFSGVNIDAGSSFTAVNMSGAAVENSIFFRDKTAIIGKVDLRAKVGGQIDFCNVTINAGRENIAVDMGSAEINDSVFFRDETSITGQVDLRAKVGGQVEFTGVRVVAGAGNKALNLLSADIRGSLYIDEGTNLIGQVDLRGKIGRELVFENVLIDSGSDSKAVLMETAVVVGTIIVRHTRIIGHWDMNGARIGTGLSVRLVPVPPIIPQPCASKPRHSIILGDLDLSFAQIKGPVWLVGMSVVGKIDARHLDVVGDLELRGCVIGPSQDDQRRAIADRITLADESSKLWTNEELNRQPLPANAIDLGLAKVQGQFWAKNSIFKGHATLEDARIEGEVNFEGGTVDGNLVLRSATVLGRVFADEAIVGPYPQVTGHLDLAYARLQQVEVRFEQNQREVTPAFIDLRGADVDTLTFHGQVRNADRPHFLAEGLSFKDIEARNMTITKDDGNGLYTGRDLARWLIWITLVLASLILSLFVGNVLLMLLLAVYVTAAIYAQWKDQKSAPARNQGVLSFLEKTYPFSTGFYIRVEQWLRESGKERTADEVFHMRRRREGAPPRPLPVDMQTKGRPLQEDWPPLRKGMELWHHFADFSMGYGARMGRLAHLFLLLWFLNWGVFSNPRSVERPLSFTQQRIDLQRGQPSLLKAEKMDANPWPDDGGVPNRGEWGSVNGFFMAMRIQVPVIGLVAENDWEPASRPMIGDLSYEEWANLMIAVNFVLIPLLIAGLTGYLKRHH